MITETDATKTDGDKVKVELDGEVHKFTKQSAKTLRNQIDDAIQQIRADIPADPVLKIATSDSSYRRDKHPFHLKHDTWGCKYSSAGTENVQCLNLAELTSKSRVTNYRPWVVYDHTSPRFDFEDYIDTEFCSKCAKRVKYWHMQREIFLTEFARKAPIGDITAADFNNYNHHQGPCDICGTPASGIAETTVLDSLFDVESPFLLCPTCRDFLTENSDGLPINSAALSSHPVNSEDIINRRTPFTEPTYTIEANEIDTEESVPDHLRNMSKDEFVDIVSDFNDVSTQTAHKLYNDGYGSIPDLADAHISNLTNITFIGRATANKIVEQAEDQLYS